MFSLSAHSIVGNSMLATGMLFMLPAAECQETPLPNTNITAEDV